MAQSDIDDLIRRLEELTPERRDAVVNRIGASSVGPHLSGASSVPVAAAAPVAAAIPRAAVTGTPDARTDKVADEVANIIYDDMHVRGGLDRQRSMLRLGARLTTPVPVSTVDSVSNIPAIATELLAYEGDIKEFTRTLESSVAVREQLRHTIAVTQASGSGKTKLAYGAGDENYLVIFIRVHSQSGSFARPWKVFLDRARYLSGLRPTLVPAHRRVVSRGALAELRLLVACYAEWVADVLDACCSVAESMRGSDTSGSAAATAAEPVPLHELRQVALRCLRNGGSEAAVAARYEDALSKLSHDVVLEHDVDQRRGDAVAKLIDDEQVKRRLRDVNDRFRKLFPTDEARTLVWFDEAQGLVDVKPQPFMAKADYEAEVNTGPTRGILYGLTAVLAWMTAKLMWAQVLCGPWLQLSERLRLPEWSCACERIVDLHHVSRITLADMQRSICRYLQISFVDIPPDTLNNLEYLRGRPRWFFDVFWVQLWQKLRSEAETVDPGGEVGRHAVAEAIISAARSARERCAQQARNMILEYWHNRLETEERRSLSALCRELYAALVLGDGMLPMHSPEAREAAIKYGLLAVDVSVEREATCGPDKYDNVSLAPRDINLRDEPVIAHALRSIGDETVRSSKPDPIQCLLSEHISGGAIMSFGLVTSLKGQLLEAALAWYVVRACLRERGPVPLDHLLCPFLPAGFELPEDFSRFLVDVERAQSWNQHPTWSKLPTVFHAFASGPGARRVVLFALDEHAGADLIIPATKDDELRLVLVQAKAKKQSRIASCLRASCPAWQYVEEPQRTCISTGEWPADMDSEPTTKRRALEELNRALPNLLSRAVRVVCTVQDYSKMSVKACNRLNAEVFPDSPVILCRSTDELGAGFNAALQRSCETAADSFVSHTTDAVWWLPHSIAAVADARNHSEAKPRKKLEPDPKAVGILNPKLASAAASCAATHGSERRRRAGKLSTPAAAAARKEASSEEDR